MSGVLWVKNSTYLRYGCIFLSPPACVRARSVVARVTGMIWCLLLAIRGNRDRGVSGGGCEVCMTICGRATEKRTRG